MTIIGNSQEKAREGMVEPNEYSADMYTRALKVLKDGRSRLDRPWGWCKNLFTGHDRHNTGYYPHCAIGALQSGAVEDGDAYTVADGLLAQCLPDPMPKTHSHIYRFNDSPTTKKADVLALYDRAIALAEEKIRAATA